MMPTGYTYKLIEEDLSFNDFAFRCAHAMGACYSLRDEGLNAPIPEKFAPSDYHKETIRKCNDVVTNLEELIHRDAHALADIDREIQQFNDLIDKDIREDKILAAMRKQVYDWCPPGDYADLKKFMLEQIDLSMDSPSTYYQDRIAELEIAKETPIVYFQSMLNNAKDDLAQAEKSLRKEQVRCDLNTAWVRGLRTLLV